MVSVEKLASSDGEEEKKFNSKYTNDTEKKFDDELGISVSLSDISYDTESITDTVMLSELHGEIKDIFKFLNDQKRLL